MRIDLGLKCFQFNFSFLLLLLNVLSHQILNLVSHHIKGSGQASNLIVRIRLNFCCRKIPLLHSFHRITEFLDREGNISGNLAGNHQGYCDQSQGYQHINTSGFSAVFQKLRHIHAAYNGPSGCLRMGQSIYFLIITLSCCNHICFGIHNQGNVFRLQFIIKLLLLWMVHNISILIQNKHIAFGSHTVLCTQFTDGAVVQVNKNYSITVSFSCIIADSAAERDHPGALPADHILYMRGGQVILFIFSHSICIPVLSIKLQIRISDRHPVIKQG